MGDYQCRDDCKHVKSEHAPRFLLLTPQVNLWSGRPRWVRLQCNHRGGSVDATPPQSACVVVRHSSRCQRLQGYPPPHALMPSLFSISMRTSTTICISLFFSLLQSFSHFREGLKRRVVDGETIYSSRRDLLRTGWIRVGPSERDVGVYTLPLVVSYSALIVLLVSLFTQPSQNNSHNPLNLSALRHLKGRPCFH